MKKTIAVVVALMLVMSMLVCAVADVLSVEEIDEKLKEYGSYLEGEWKATDTYTKLLGERYTVIIDAKGSGLSMTTDGVLYASSYSANGEILLTNDKNTIYVKIPTNGGAYMLVEMNRK